MKYHMSLNVRGFLSHNKFPDKYIGMFRHDNGRSMEPGEAREILYDELAKGHEVIPMCFPNDCPDYDYGKDGGCPGHEEAA